jgi:hypothetical protein
MTKYLTEARRIDFAHGLRVSVCNGRKGMMECSISHRGCQEAERQNVYSNWLLLLSPFIPLGTPSYGLVLLTEPAFSIFVNPLWKHPHKHTQGCALLISYVIISPIKLTIKINNHKGRR